MGKIRDAIDQIDIDALGLVFNNRGLKKTVNKEIFIKLLQELENLEPEDVTPEDALKYINYQQVKQVFENKVNKGTLDKLGDAFKAFAGVVVIALLSPLIVLAALIALVIIGARYAGIGVIVAGEKIKEEAEVIKEGVIKAEKEVKSFSKDVEDIIHALQARERFFLVNFIKS